MSSAVPASDSDRDGTRALVHRLFVAARTVATYGEQHPHSMNAAAELAAAMRGAGPPYAVQFIGDAVFRDMKLVPGGYEDFLHGQQLGQVMASLGAREIRVERVPEPRDLLQLLSALGHAFSGSTDPLELIKVPGLSWRDIPGALWGEAGECVDPEVFVLGQVALAVSAAEDLGRDGGMPCDWPTALSIIRRLERALDTNSPGTLRALELAPGSWSQARRSVSGAILALAVMRHIGTAPNLARVATHAALALGLFGLAPRSGLPFVQAATAATAMLSAPASSRLGAEPHRLRVSVVIDRIARFPEDRSQWLPLSALVEIVYEMERRRCPADLSFDLSRVDLLAVLVDEAGRPFDPTWVRAVLGTMGVIPPGARVRLADGREAVAVEPGSSGDPRRPVVLLEGRLVVPDAPVILLAGAASRG